MVGMATTFGGADYTTPHGGQPFHYWKQGYGFGYGRGPGQAFLDPSLPETLRYTPNGDRALASSPFWRRKYEIGPACGFGIGDRPEPNKAGKDGANTAGPTEYGDVSKCLSKVKKNVTRKGISIKARYPSMEEKYRDLSWPECGPGPGKYDTRIEAGKSSWTSPSAMPSWSLAPRGVSGNEKKEDYFKPGPTAYEVRSRPGENYPIKRGTLYDVSIKGRAVSRNLAGERSPGPGRYQLRGQGGTMPMRGRPLDEYGLWEKIANVKVPPRRSNQKGRSMALDDEGESEEEEEEEEEFVSHALSTASRDTQRRMQRVASSPG